MKRDDNEDPRRGNVWAMGGFLPRQAHLLASTTTIGEAFFFEAACTQVLSTNEDAPDGLEMCLYCKYHQNKRGVTTPDELRGYTGKSKLSAVHKDKSVPAAPRKPTPVPPAAVAKSLEPASGPAPNELTLF